MLDQLVIVSSHKAVACRTALRRRIKRNVEHLRRLRFPKRFTIQRFENCAAARYPFDRSRHPDSRACGFLAVCRAADHFNLGWRNEATRPVRNCNIADVRSDDREGAERRFLPILSADDDCGQLGDTVVLAERDHRVHVFLPCRNDDFGNQRGLLIGEEGVRKNRNPPESKKLFGGFSAHARGISRRKNQRGGTVFRIACKK